MWRNVDAFVAIRKGYMCDPHSNQIAEIDAMQNFNQLKRIISGATYHTFIYKLLPICAIGASHHQATGNMQHSSTAPSYGPIIDLRLPSVGIPHTSATRSLRTGGSNVRQIDIPKHGNARSGTINTFKHFIHNRKAHNITFHIFQRSHNAQSGQGHSSAVEALDER
jgi:hypothetical protein